MRRGAFAGVLAVLLAAPAAARADKVVEAQTVWRFDASTYAIDQGEKVTFKNSDAVSPGPHNVTSNAKEGDKPIFASRSIGNGEQAPVEGAERLKTGEYDFICTVHPFMEATLKVSDKGTPVGASSPPPAAEPSAPADTTAPKLRTRLRSSSARSSLKRGRLVASVTTDELSTVRLTAKAGDVTLAKATATDGAPGRAVRFALRLTAAGRRTLRAAHRRLAVTLTAVATDSTGNATTARARRTLRR